MKTISITSAFIGIFSGLFGAFFKMFHMPMANEMLLTSLVLSSVAVVGMTLFVKKQKAERELVPVQVEQE